MSVSDTNKNRGAHGDSSFMLGGLPSSSENPAVFSVGSAKGYVMDYTELAKSLRQCAEGSCAGCKNDLVQIGCRGMLQREAADAIEELVQVRDHQRDILSRFGGETGIRQAFERMDDYWRLVDKYKELLRAAKKMHTWIFLHTGDEQKAYDECGLSEDMNIALGYSGQIEFRATKPEEEP